MSYFADALDGKGGAQLPAVSYLKAPAYQDGHPGYSDPTDEQHFLVNTINAIEKSRYWSSTAIVIMWDDSDGWYDSAVPPVINGSNDPATDTALCTSKPGNLTDTTSVVSFIEDNWLHGSCPPVGSPAAGRAGARRVQPPRRRIP